MQVWIIIAFEVWCIHQQQYMKFTAMLIAAWCGLVPIHRLRLIDLAMMDHFFNMI